MSKNFLKFSSIASSPKVTFRHLAPENLQAAQEITISHSLACMKADDNRRPSGALLFRPEYASHLEKPDHSSIFKK
jgi:hypothetical protein